MELEGRTILKIAQRYETGSYTMNQLAQINHKLHSGPICRECGAPMRLFGIEAHPTVDRTDLRTYVCRHCDEVQTEDVPLSWNEAEL
jgi:ribosomal protein L40E